MKKQSFDKITFLVLYVAYTSIYIARINLSVASPELISDNILDTVQIGLLGSVFSTVYAIGRLINGSISDRTPPWVMLSVGLGLAGISNILIGFFPPFMEIFILWLTNAYAQSMLWSSVLCVVSSIYDNRTAKNKVSVMVTSVAMGNIMSIIVNTYLITRFGAKFAFIVPGFLTAVLGLVTLLMTKNINPLPQQTKNKHIPIYKLLKNKGVLTMIVPSLLHGVMKDNISLWMAVFVVDRYGIDLSDSAYYILLIPAIGFVGRIMYPILYRICKNKENTVSMLGFSICAVASVILCLSKINIICAVLCLSIIYAAVSMINTSILSIYPLHFTNTGNVASVSGVMDFATYLGAGISGVIYGAVIKTQGYFPMFLSWAVISLISLMLLKEVNKSEEKAI